MTDPKMSAFIHILQNSNFSSPISNFDSISSTKLQKCCRKDQLYSVEERKCVFHNFTTSLPKGPHPDLSKFDIHYGFPCWYSGYWYFETTSRIRNVFHNGSLTLNMINNEETYQFEQGQYCFDVATDTFKFNPLLITCDQSSVLSVQIGYLIPYFISILLVATTFCLYLAIPELRVKIKDKCLMCYLASLTFWMIIYADVWEMNGICFLKKIVSKEVCISLDWYSFMVTFSWLNVMCIHLWRIVTNVNSIPQQSIYAYVLYALGLPLICRILFYIDLSISDLRNFAYRVQHGGLFDNPELRYRLVVCCIQQIINISIFFRVGYIIWNQKRRWRRNEDHVKIKHHCRQKKMLTQLLRLFVIVDLEWISIFLTLYFGIIGTENILSLFCFWVKLSPGYFIFIVYVCCNKQVISSLRKRLPKISKKQRNRENATSNDFLRSRRYSHNHVAHFSRSNTIIL